MKFIILHGRNFNSYTNHQSSSLWRGDFFLALGAFFLGSALFFSNTNIVPREYLVISLCHYFTRKGLQFIHEPCKFEFVKGRLLFSPRGFFPRYIQKDTPPIQTEKGAIPRKKAPRAKKMSPLHKLELWWFVYELKFLPCKIMNF